jgi:TATA-binding protein-associated factor
MEASDSKGQEVIDCLTVLPAVVPSLRDDMHERVIALFPLITLGVQSKFAVIRYATARCLASLCDSLPVAGLRHVVLNIVPLLGDPIHVNHRRGAIELISCAWHFR